MMFSSGYYLYKIRERERREKEQLKQLQFDNLVKQQQTEQELVETRNAYLKAQINPHFLFNTLDFVYHSISSNPVIASQAIIYLSKMMRFAIDADKKGIYINLGEELMHVKTLFSLFKLRKPNYNLPEVSYDLTIAELEFIPLIILTIAENMIKHGDFSNPDLNSQLMVYISDNYLCISSRNPIYDSPKVASNHLGLENIQKRLIFSYGENVSFSYHIGMLEFELQIRVPIQSAC
jgi:LytS/YehU family sensor histidine kinase